MLDERLFYRRIVIWQTCRYLFILLDNGDLNTTRCLLSALYMLYGTLLLSCRLNKTMAKSYPLSIEIPIRHYLEHILVFIYCGIEVREIN
jgi:hypothetical protein